MHCATINAHNNKSKQDTKQTFAMNSEAFCIYEDSRPTRSSFAAKEMTALQGMSSGHSMSECHTNLRQNVCMQARFESALANTEPKQGPVSCSPQI